MFYSQLYTKPPSAPATCKYVSGTVISTNAGKIHICSLALEIDTNTNNSKTKSLETNGTIGKPESVNETRGKGDKFDLRGPEKEIMIEMRA